MRNVKKALPVILILVFFCSLIVIYCRNNQKTKYLKLIEKTSETNKIIISYTDEKYCGFCEYKQKRIITDVLEITDVIKILNQMKLSKGSNDIENEYVYMKNYKFEMFNSQNELILEFTIPLISINSEKESFAGELQIKKLEELVFIAEKNDNLS